MAEHFTEMPYKRGAGCELCGAHEPLRRVALSPPSGDKGGNYRLARAIYVCFAHADDEIAGAPRKAPARTTRAGTSRRQPQTEALW